MGYFNPIPEKNFLIDVILKTIIDIVVVVSIAFFFIIFFCDKSVVIGSSMSSELGNGETVLINKMSYLLGEPERFDVIVYENGNGPNIKRIIGLPGERIKIVDSKIYINGEILEDIYFSDTFESGYVTDEIEIAPDEYFVLGDNRNVSEDSRFSYVGNVKSDEIIGKAWLIAAPFERIGFID